MKTKRDNLKMRIRRSGYTQAEFALMLGISESYLSMLISGSRSSAKVSKRIAKILKGRRAA